jgi:hypothetical protein
MLNLSPKRVIIHRIVCGIAIRDLAFRRRHKLEVGPFLEMTVQLELGVRELLNNREKRVKIYVASVSYWPVPFFLR